MTYLKKYLQYTFLRSKGTNTQLTYLFDFAQSKNINLKTYMGKKWDKTIWPILERILKGEEMDEETSKILNGWDRENRTKEEYAVKVMLAWLVEDILQIYIQEMPCVKEKYKVMKGGTDSERKFKRANQCNSDPDLFLLSKKTGEKIQLEVVQDNGGYVFDNGELDTRVRRNGTGKYTDIQEKTKEEGTIAVFIVIFDVKRDELTFLRIDEETVVLRTGPNPKWNGRICTTIEVSKELIRYQLTPKIAA